ncbi:MAG: methionine adenosyltransferase [Polyangiaceae bacterium]|nr:methionine adenosyltransferase [Polyangiaceae bacterium]
MTAIRVDAMLGPGQAELVERKGLGHPDTICDALAEELSRALCQFYLERFGTVLHHNVDKALLVGGVARPRFGGGEVIEPIEIHLAGRAVTRVGSDQIPVTELALRSATEWLKQNLRGLDVERHVRIVTHVRPGSLDLSELFQRRERAHRVLANDTSIGVGFAPLSALEQAVLAAERTLNEPGFRDLHPAGGEDVKVMGRRDGARAALTVARAFVDRHLPDLDAYLAAKEVVRARVREVAAAAFDELAVTVNAGDDPAQGTVYLTVTGLSAEAGDDGQVGRGNRVNGLITPYRPMSLEAAAGKNPVSHVGKLYNLVAADAAQALCSELEGVLGAEVYLVSSIGRPIDEPDLAQARLWLRDGAELSSLAPRAGEVVGQALARLPALLPQLLRGDIRVY